MRAGKRSGSPLYLIPIVIGMCGVLFAQQIDAPALRIIVILVSVAAPVFAAGIVLGRLYSQGFERVVLLIGLVLLCVGALATASGFTEDLTKLEEVPPSVVELSRWLGLASLFIGLLAVLVLLVRREEAIGEIGDRFRHLAEHMGDGFLLSSPEGIIVLVNQRFLDMAGLREQEVVGRNARELAERLGLDSVVSHLDQRAKGLASEYQVTWYVNGEERYFWMSGAPIFTRRGVHAGTLATVRDITDRVRLSQRLERFAQGLQKLVEDRTQLLRLSEERLRDLLLHMNEGFVTLDDHYRIDFANERLGEMVGAAPADLNEKDIFSFTDPADKTRLYELFELAERGEAVRISQEIGLLHAEGHVTPAVVAVSALPEGDIEGPRFSMVVTDVSVLKTMQHQLEQRAEELQVANEELRMLDRAKDTFLSNVTHELRTPLSTVRGYVEMLHSGNLGELGPAQENALRVMERNLHRLGTLIDEMIDFSRMEIRGIRLSLGLCDLEKVVDEVIGSAHPQLEAKQMFATFSVNPATRRVWGDRQRIGQVLTILLSNAIKFSHQGSKVHVSVVPHGDNGVGIEVIDTGIGIESMYHRRVFAKFFQVDSSMNRRYEGAGIGLSIAKSIVEAHGGYIELDSEPGKGSTFRIVLPASVFSAKDSSPVAHHIRDRAPRVLVLDDEPDFLAALRETIQSVNGDVRCATSGHEGLRIAEEVNPDVVVVGPSTPDLSGPDAARKMNERFPNLPLVLVRPMGGNVAMLDFPAETLESPFDGNHFLHALWRACGGEVNDTAPESDAAAGTRADTRPRVVVFDEDAEFLEWIHGGLTRRQIACYTATTLDDARELIGRVNPDVVLADIDALTPGSSAALRSDINGAIACAMTCMPMENGALHGFQEAFQKPFAIDMVLNVVEHVRR